MLHSPAIMNRVITKEEMLQEAVEAGQSGELGRARELLLELLRQDNREPLYWLLMSTAVVSREERIYCLQNVLFLDPDNSAAKHDLELLGAEVPQENAPALVPEDQDNWQTVEIAAPKFPKKKARPKEEPWSITWIFGTLGVGLVIIMLGYYAAEMGFLDAVLPNPTSTVGPPTQQLLAGATRTPGTQITATREIAVVPRDPSELLASTYTPTPLYVNTPHAESAAFQQGLNALAAEDWELATESFQDFLTANPQAADAAYYLGEAYLGARDLTAAQTAFNQAIALNGQFAPAYLGLARVAIEQAAEPAEILTNLNTAILLDPNYGDAYLARAGYYLGRGDADLALADVLSAENLSPLSALVQYYKATVFLAREEFAPALQASLRAYEIDLTLLQNYLVLAESRIELQQNQQAIETMLTYLGFEGTDGRGWELLGLAYKQSGQSDLALQSFDRALELDPNLPEAAYHLGLAEKANENHQRALGLFRIAVIGRPEWFEARIALAEEHLATGNPSAAFLEINSSSELLETDVQRAAFFYWRALTLEALGQAENALADWRSLLNLPTAAVPAEWREIAEQRVAGS